MAKPGDTVRFLNTTGGGKITRIDGKIAYVEEEGFETPVLLKDVVVVLPAGQKKPEGAAKLMFDQKAFDEGRREELPAKETTENIKQEVKKEIELPIVETTHGDKLNISLAFEPTNLKKLDVSAFNAVLVNDSNYYLDFSFLRRADGERGWSLVFTGTVAPNELIDLARLTHEDLPEYDRISLQCIAYKKDKAFTMQPPVSVSKNLDLTKFHKFHCFRPGLYFDTPVLEITLVKDDVVAKSFELSADEIAEKLSANMPKKAKEADRQKKHPGNNKNSDPASNPHKLLPLIEVDLHIGELTDTTAGMEPKDMLEMQLETVRRHMRQHSRRIGQKIVFIHGKGEGVLRKAVKDLLAKEFPKAELQDASFREYGFGATLVTIH